MQSDCIFQWMCLPFRVLEKCLNLQDVHIYCVCDKPFSHWQRLCSAELQYKAHLPQNMTTNMTPQRYMILNPPSIHDNRSHNGSTTPFCRYLEGRAEDCTIQSTGPPTQPAGGHRTVGLRISTCKRRAVHRHPEPRGPNMDVQSSPERAFLHDSFAHSIPIHQHQYGLYSIKLA